ncbi:MAG: hypothetical protein PHV37_00525 [Candidatus Gastranaerophilales bacterium]|nr:hypothetical protein [Candidatus Gastranaerophilales bacterium]
MVYALNSGLIISYTNLVSSKTKMTSKQLFAMFSLSIGGDGTSITKSQLSSFIKEADDGLVKVGKTRLKNLKTLEKDWDDLFNKKDSISQEDFNKLTPLFLSAMIESDDDHKTDLSKINRNEKKNALWEKSQKALKETLQEVKEKLLERLEASKLEKEDKKVEEDNLLQQNSEKIEMSDIVSFLKNKQVTKKDLTDYLVELIDKNTSELDNTPFIDSVTNLISEFEKIADYQKQVQSLIDANILSSGFSPVNIKV